MFEGYKIDCHAATKAQLARMGYKESGKRYLIATGVYPKDPKETYSFDYHRTEFINGVKYIKAALQKNIPVTVGIDDWDDRIKKKLKAQGKKIYVNPDGITDHFIVIVGMGTDEIGNYFLFYDNATNLPGVGVSNQNRLYCDCTKPTLSGKADLRNPYFVGQVGVDGHYVVSTIRESVKK